MHKQRPTLFWTRLSAPDCMIYIYLCSLENWFREKTSFGRGESSRSAVKDLLHTKLVKMLKREMFWSQKAGIWDARQFCFQNGCILQKICFLYWHPSKLLRTYIFHPRTVLLVLLRTILTRSGFDQKFILVGSPHTSETCCGLAWLYLEPNSIPLSAC